MLIKKIQEDLTLSIKNRDVLRSSLLKTLKGECDRFNREPSDETVLKVLKKVKEGLLSSPSTETSIIELSIIEEYLPMQLTEDEMDILIERVIKNSPNAGFKGFGTFMKEVSSITKGTADMQYVSKKLKEILN